MLISFTAASLRFVEVVVDDECVYNVLTVTARYDVARDLTIQIRLSKEEHDTIAAQAAREGLGVGTYLRALALRTAFEASPSPRGRAFRALRDIHARSKAMGTDKLSMEEIDAEIQAARTARRRR
jgi:predicted DNA binding CopG/RHH family protein